MTRSEAIVARLRTALAPTHLELEDDSRKHAGHPGARTGGGHFLVRVVSERFSGLDRLARHRAVYDALGDLMGREIHALSAETFTPDEWRSRGGEVAAGRPERS